jgi:tyrosinase
VVAPSAATRGRRKGILVLPLAFSDGRFTRADLVFTGVDHSGPSYEVLTFLNNASATDTTPHDIDRGYGGRFVIFGHGGCFGDLGHCDIPTDRPPGDLRPPHPLEPTTKIVTVTDALRRILGRGDQLTSVTLVPVELTPRRSDQAISPDVLRFAELELRTYLTATDSDLPEAGQE